MATKLPDIQDIFNEALGLGSHESRMNYLEQACGDDCHARARVEALLRAHSQAGGFFGGKCAADFATQASTVSEMPGTHIGPYKLREVLGEGGMGVVFVAEQVEPVRRRVALKVIKPGMDTQQVIARFEAEKQALAMMDHPNIARIYDAGTTGGEGPGTSGQEPGGSSLAPGSRPLAPSAGRPYFVMELVRGMPITEYCDQTRLTPRQRLELFATVCQAVQHAHQKGIIHRDIKPSNILVTLHDGTPVVKVIDFGVAKALNQQLTDRSIYTALTQLVGTPLYMSPEQAEMSGLDVDTRSDVYSLGVLLYELLTGQTPFDKETLASAGLDEMRRKIREDEPPRPSTRVSTLQAQALSTISQRRSTDPRRISATLRGELDWIVMKALEKDRSRRYESASAFATDIQRYLSDEPVLACPPSTMYRFQKFSRKHKPALATAAAIALCLILGTTVSAWQAVRATAAESQAAANEAKAKEAAAAEAQQRQLAEANAQKANTSAAAAQEKEHEAINQRDEVEKLNHTLQRTLYAAHMNLAQNAWDEAAISRLQQLLDQYRPKPGQPDVRGFEWHYLQRLHQGGELLALKEVDEDSDDYSFERVVFTPDGKRLISDTPAWTGSSIGEPKLYVWDAQTGKKLLDLKGDRSFVVSPDGTRLASAVTTYDVTQKLFVSVAIKVWDVQTGRELFSLIGHTGDIASLAYSPDGKHLASASGHPYRGQSATGEVKIWDAETGRELFTLPGRVGDVHSIAFCPDGKRLAHGISGEVKDGKRTIGAVKIWDVQTGQEFLSLQGGGGSVAFSPDGNQLASRSGSGSVWGTRLPVPEEVKVWDARTGREVSSLDEKSDSGILFAFSPDGKRLAIAGDRSKMPRIKICDTQSGQEVFALFGHSAGAVISHLAFSPDSKRLASTASDRTLKVWDLEIGGEIRTMKDGMNSVAYSPDGKRLASASDGRGVKVWDANEDPEVITFRGNLPFNPGSDVVYSTNVALSPDFKRLAIPDADHTIKLWDPWTARELVTLKGHEAGVGKLVFSPDGKRVASASGTRDDDKKVYHAVALKVWDAESGREIASLQGHTARPHNMAFSPDGKLLASGSGRWEGKTSGELKIWDVQSARELHTCSGYTTDIWRLVFSPDGKRLVSSSTDGMLKFWDAPTGQELLSVKTTGRATGLAFSPDGKRLVSSHYSGRPLALWDAQTGKQLLTFHGDHQDYVTCVAFSPDGNRLASASRDGMVKVWDSHTAQELLTLKGQARGVGGVAFSPDGTRLAIFWGDGTVKIWDATPLPEKKS